MEKLFTFIKSLGLVLVVAMALYIGWMSSILLAAVTAVIAVYFATGFLKEFKRRASL